MDPIIIARIATIRQQEFIEQAQYDDPRWVGQVRQRVGNWLVTLGERMRAAASTPEVDCGPDIVPENC